MPFRRLLGRLVDILGFMTGVPRHHRDAHCYLSFGDQISDDDAAI